LGFSGVFSLSHLLLFGVLLYTSCMLRGAFTLLIKFSTYLSKKSTHAIYTRNTWKRDPHAH
jgi:hypothetical protein